MVEVPVVAIITKIDSLKRQIQSDLFQKLTEQGKSIIDAKRQAASESSSHEEAKLKEDYIDRLNAAPYPPARIVCLRGRLFLYIFSDDAVWSVMMIHSDMHKPGSNSDELVNKTAETLNRTALTLLYVSVLRNNIEDCIDHAIKR
jgi:hypothetical protein